MRARFGKLGASVPPSAEELLELLSDDERRADWQRSTWAVLGRAGTYSLTEMLRLADRLGRADVFRKHLSEAPHLPDAAPEVDLGDGSRQVAVYYHVEPNWLRHAWAWSPFIAGELPPLRDYSWIEQLLP